MALVPRRIAIVGFGTAGQAAAILLSRDGHAIEVFEQTGQLGPVGAGVLLQPVGLQVLWEMGLLAQACSYGRRIGRLFGESASSRVVMDMRYADLDRRMYGLGMQRGALFSLLAAALDGAVQVHGGCRIEDVSEDGRRIRDAGGAWHGPYDLVIAADGSASRLRRCIGAMRMDRVYPWGALWCLLDQADWPYPHELRQRYVKARKMIGMLPVGSRQDDATERLSFFWSLPTSEFDSWAAGGFRQWQDEIEGLWPEARARMSSLQDGSALSRATYRDAIPPRWYRNRLVLIGDSAHAMSPQLGQGVNMALLDARAICDSLRAFDSIEASLAQYAQSRRRHVSAYQFWSRWLTPVFQSRRDRLAALRDLAFHPMGRAWGLRSLMLRVLSGTQMGWFGRLDLPAPFLDQLERVQASALNPAAAARANPHAD